MWYGKLYAVHSGYKFTTVDATQVCYMWCSCYAVQECSATGRTSLSTCSFAASAN